MTTDVQTPVESSPAENALADKPTLQTLSPDEYKTWRKTGEFPQPKKAEAAPAAKTSEADAPDASAVKPESETGNPSKPKLNAEERIKQLARKNRELVQQLEALKTPKAEAKSEAEPAQETEPVEPNVEDFDDWNTYQKALSKYTRDLAKFEAKREMQAERANEAKAKTQAERAKAAKEIEQAWNNQLDAAEELMPDIRDRMVSDDLAVSEPMAIWMQQSEIGAKVLMHLIENPDKSAEIAKLTGRPLVKALVKIEDLIEQADTKQSDKQEPKPKIGTPVKATKAAPPAKELSTNGGSPMDELEQALANKDFVRYREIMNRRERQK